MDTVIPNARPGLGEIFTTWLICGIQSFGGGSSTFYLIHQACIDRHWLSEEEFVRLWALAQIAPGINLLKLTVMVGYRLRGWSGMLTAAAGLIVPSAFVTVVMTAGFATIRSLPFVQAVLKGILPATIGLSLAMGAQMAQPLFTRAHKEGLASLGTHTAILLGAAALMAIPGISPVIILLLAGAAAMLLLAVVPIARQDVSVGDGE